MKYEIQGNVRQPQRMAYSVLIAMCYGCSSSANMQYVGHDTLMPRFACTHFVVDIYSEALFQRCQIRQNRIFHQCQLYQDHIDNQDC